VHCGQTRFALAPELAQILALLIRKGKEFDNNYFSPFLMGFCVYLQDTLKPWPVAPWLSGRHIAHRLAQLNPFCSTGFDIVATNDFKNRQYQTGLSLWQSFCFPPQSGCRVI
jgi:hypothetical protein